MKKNRKDKLIQMGIVGVLVVVALVVSVKLYETTIPKKQNYQITIKDKSDILVDKLETDINEDIEKKLEENDLNIVISPIEKIEVSEKSGNVENIIKDETDDGKTIIIVNEEKPKIPETPTVTNEDELVDDSKEPEYEEIPTVKENQVVEGDVVQGETDALEYSDYIPGTGDKF